VRRWAPRRGASGWRAVPRDQPDGPHRFSSRPHNHPTAISRSGAATGSGGEIRDDVGHWPRCSSEGGAVRLQRVEFAPVEIGTLAPIKVAQPDPGLPNVTRIPTRIADVPMMLEGPIGAAALTTSSTDGRLLSLLPAKRPGRAARLPPSRS